MPLDTPLGPPLPTPDSLAFLAQGGDMGERMRALDWAATPLGPAALWPQSLRTSVSTCLNCAFPILVWWGPELVMLYNDEYRPMLGAAKHPRALGAPGAVIWPEIWDLIGPMLRQVLERGEATRSRDMLLILERNGYPEECFFSFSYSPIHDETGGIGGVFCPVIETTERVVGERRLRTLSDLGAQAQDARGAAETCAAAATTLGQNPGDLPFALIYLTDGDGARARCVARAGIAADHPVAPATIALTGTGLAEAPWPLAEALAAPRDVRAEPTRHGHLPGGPWPEPTSAVVILPLATPGEAQPAGFLVAGTSPRRPLDAAYRAFLDLVARHIAAAVASARAYEAERRRSEALAELDRAKTVFFSNVSHEFRTPLTLMLGPLEDMLADGERLSALDRERATTAHRSALRLLRLVNTLLDFARVEAGRAEAHFAPTDLAALTTDLASLFRSACERAGLSLRVECPPLPQPVHVDREMWEKIVLNLLSNAFKFTFAGTIAVALGTTADRAVLTVRDTGTGIPAAALPRLFERFHRVEGAVGRSHEGSGIGLALVKELVQLHGGEITVESEPGRGSSFSVSIPLGSAHLPAAQVAGAASTGASPTTAIRAEAFVEEALRWLPEPLARHATPLAPEAEEGMKTGWGNGPRILVADDNADMRAYLRHLLQASGYRVAVATDGEAALAAALAEPPDLVLTDVMMPRLDGFGLLRALRADRRTREVPVLLVSARAGEEAEVEGLEAGADDYLVKPFAARELLARLSANLRLARLRREAAQREVDARFRALAQASSDVFYSMSPDWSEMRQLNRHGFLADTPEPTADWLQAYIPPEEQPRVLAAIQDAVRKTDLFELEHRVCRPDGSIGWTLSRAVPILDEHGKVTEWFGAASDVTERHIAEERQALLTREVDHRAKNILAVVQAALRLTPKDDLESYAHAIEGRVAALARAHTILAAGKWQPAALRELIEAELAAFQPCVVSGEHRVVIDGPALALLPGAVQALSMVLHELATNAAKYGALSTAAGRVLVCWRVDREAGRLRLGWQERGGPRVTQPPTRRGFGSRVITTTVESQLGGTLDRIWSEDGLHCEIAVPLDRVLASQTNTPAGVGEMGCLLKNDLDH